MSYKNFSVCPTDKKTVFRYIGFCECKPTEAAWHLPEPAFTVGDARPVLHQEMDQKIQQLLTPVLPDAIIEAAPAPQHRAKKPRAKPLKKAA